MRVLITGAAGYIGTSLVDLLTTDPELEEIIVYDNLNRGTYGFFLPPRDREVRVPVRFVNADILDSRLLKASLEGVDVVVHMAARVTTPFADRDAHAFEQVNHWGTAELTYAVEQSSSVRRLIYLSSAAVYGDTQVEVDIDSPVHPVTIYGTSKLRGERHVKRLSEGVETYIVRCGNVYGHNRSMRIDSVVNSFMFDAKHQRRLTIHGTGEQWRPFVHVDEVSTVLCRLISADIGPDTYNLVARSMTVDEVADQVAAVYPGIERLYANQDLPFRNLRVARDPRLDPLLDEPDSFADELERFRAKLIY